MTLVQADGGDDALAQVDGGGAVGGVGTTCSSGICPAALEANKQWFRRLTRFPAETASVNPRQLSSIRRRKQTYQASSVNPHDPPTSSNSVRHKHKCMRTRLNTLAASLTSRQPSALFQP